MKDNKQIERHLFANADGKVLVLRIVGKDYKTYGGFKNPENVGEFVESPDWNDGKECGGGIHGWALGVLGNGKEKDFAAIWQVYEVDPADGLIELGTKCKFRKGKLVYSGTWFGALEQTLAVRSGYWSYFVKSNENGSGDSSSAATSGDFSSAATSGNYSSAATSGDASAAVVSGISGMAMAGNNGCIALSWWNKTAECREMRCAETGHGVGQLKPHTWYKLDAETGAFVESEGAK